MGKKLVIKGADFSANGIFTAMLYAAPNTEISFKLDGNPVVFGTTDNDGYLEIGELSQYTSNPSPSFNRFMGGSGANTVKILKLGWTIKTSSMENFFSVGTDLEYVDLSNCITEKKVNLNASALQLYKLKTVNLSNLTIGEFGDSFWQCTALKEVILRNCTLPSSLGDAFMQSCSALEKVDMRGCSASAITMFKNKLNAQSAGGSSTWNEYNTGILTKN